MDKKLLFMVAIITCWLVTSCSDEPPLLAQPPSGGGDEISGASGDITILGASLNVSGLVCVGCGVGLFANASVAGGSVDSFYFNVTRPDGINDAVNGGVLSEEGAGESLVNLLIKSNLTSASMSGVRGVFISGDYLYVAAYDAQALTIINVTNRSEPKKESEFVNTSSLYRPYGVVVKDDVAYVTDSYGGNARVVAINVTDKKNPRQISVYNNAALLNGAQAIAVVGDLIYVVAYNSDALAIINISDPENMFLVGSLKNSTGLDRAKGLAVQDNYVYVAAERTPAGYLTTINVTDPSNPKMTGSIIPGDSKTIGAVVVDGDYGYGVDGLNYYFMVFNLTDRSNPSNLYKFYTGPYFYSARQLDKKGDYVFAASSLNDSVVAINVTDPSSPVIELMLINSTILDGSWTITHDDDYLYAGAAYTGGVSVLVPEYNKIMSLYGVYNDTDVAGEYSINYLWANATSGSEDYIDPGLSFFVNNPSSLEFCPGVYGLEFLTNISRGYYNPSANTYSEPYVLPSNQSSAGCTYMINNSLTIYDANYSLWTNLSSNNIFLFVNGEALNSTKNMTLTVNNMSVVGVNLSLNITNMPLTTAGVDFFVNATVVW